MATKTKTKASLWLFTLLLIKVSISPSASEEPVVLWDNEQSETIPDADVGAGADAEAVAGGGADAGADADVHDAEGANASRIEFLDVTDLRDGLNDWNFLGMWSKYDLSDLQEEHKLVPENPERDDQAVLICHTLPMGSILEKKFPALENGTLILSYYLAAKANFSMLGQAIDLAIDKTQEIFNYSFPHDLAEHNDTWIMESFKLLNFSNEFKVKFTLVGDPNGLWATDEIEVRGFKPKSSPIVIPGLPEPGDNSTDIVVPGVQQSTQPTIESNATVDVDATTEGSNIVSGNGTSSGNETHTNVNGTDTDSPDNGDNTTDGPEEPIPGPSSFEDSNVTAIPSSHLTEASPSNVSQETNVTLVPGVNWNDHSQGANVTVAPGTHWSERPELNMTNAPQGDVSGPPETNLTHGPGVHVWTEGPRPNGTNEPAANDSVLPPNIPGKPPNGAPDNPHSGYPSGISDTSSFEENVNKLAGVAQAIWDAFYVFLALFCACLVAIVGLIVRGRCNSPSGTGTAPLQLSPPTTPGQHPIASTRSTTTPATTPTQYERSV